jgi:7,8-dihydropterin-6-yl-methyl-4-(beta-D-ribofuranosyl)aminobenzene 5'-phosphate synthase
VDILLPGDQVAQRAPLHPDWSERDQLIAEHGYSLLLTIQYGDHTEALLYDAGLGRNTAMHNMDVLGLNLRELRTVVLSHGHADHHGGLEGLYRRVSRRSGDLLARRERGEG